MEELDNHDREEIFAKAVRAGKRTYFFDVRSTKGNDYYLTITESKKRFQEDGSFQYQKHKIFLYKEDFEKFSEALAESFRKIIELKQEKSDEMVNRISDNFIDIDFDDLGHSEENTDSKE